MSIVMETSGFRVRIDLSQFFNDIKKFSCIYVDLSRDRQIADVVDRISELFGIERPLFLLDERFYLPESENVNVLRDSNVVKVFQAFHSQNQDSCTTTDHLTKSVKTIKYLRDEVYPEQTSFAKHKTENSDNIDSHNSYQNGEVGSSSVLHVGKEVDHVLHGKKRKHSEFDNRVCAGTSSHINVPHQVLEPEIHYPKKCKRKKEKIRKEIVNGNTSEHSEDELEEKNNDCIHFETKDKRKKKRNKVEKFNGENSENRASTVVVNHSSLQSLHDLNDLTTTDSKNLKKHKKKRREDLSSLPTQKHKTLDLVIPHSIDVKNHKKKLSQNDTEDGVPQDQSLLLSSDTAFLSTCSQVDRKCIKDSTSVPKNIETIVNNRLENNDSIENTQPDFAHSAVSSTPTHKEGKTREVAHFPSQNNVSVFISSLGSLENSTESFPNTQPKRKRVRTRKHKKRTIVQNDKIVSVPAILSQPLIRWAGVPPKKHIRFEEEEDENIKADINHNEGNSANDTTVGNNITGGTGGSKESPNLNTKYTQEPTEEVEATDCAMKNSIDHFVPENHNSKNDSSPLTHQAPFHQQWALNTEKLNLDSKESLQKLLALGKQNSFPIIFERKSQSTNCSSASESSTLVSKQNDNNKKAEETYFPHNTVELMDPTDITCPKKDPTAIDPLRYPQLEGKPKKNDIIAFKVLKLTTNYTPEISDFIIAKVLNISEETLEMLLQIEVGEPDLEAPKGKFSVENENSEKSDSNSKLRQLNWNELMDVRIMFP